MLLLDINVNNFTEKSSSSKDRNFTPTFIQTYSENYNVLKFLFCLEKKKKKKVSNY